ncbi:MAG: type II toxin-antitoxin system PemK/MazF family toxin [Desulfovibrionales bacterium]|nr:type II toxin-antitoxin system PemK/MazF family toxin [Desulfovibrionales bacterium]
MKTGEIYWVNLDPTIGSEIQKKRPVIVLNGGHKKHLKLAIVVPLTAWDSQWTNNPLFVPIEPDKNNQLQKISAVDCFQIRAISHQRFAEKIGSIPEEKIHLIKQALSLILDIEPEHCE